MHTCLPNPHSRSTLLSRSDGSGVLLTCELALMSNGELSLSIAGESPLLMGGKDEEGLGKPGPRIVGGDAVEVWDGGM
jgi:hypothetical protein